MQSTYIPSAFSSSLTKRNRMTDDVHSVFDFPSSLIGTRSKHTRNNLLTFQRSARELILAPDPDPIAESRGLIAEPLFCHSWRHIFGFAPALVASHVYAHSHPALTSLKVALSRHCATILDMRHWHLGAQRSSG